MLSTGRYCVGGIIVLTLAQKRSGVYKFYYKLSRMKKTEDLTLEADKYFALVEELEAIKTEETFNIGLMHVQFAHMWGKTIRDYHPEERGLHELLNRVSKDVGRTTRSLYKYVELYDRYPVIQEAIDQHGKNVSVRLLLGTSEAKEEGEERPECTHCCPRHCK